MNCLYVHDVKSIKTNVHLLEETQTYSRKIWIETKEGIVEINLFSKFPGSLDMEVDEQ